MPHLLVYNISISLIECSAKVAHFFGA